MARGDFVDRAKASAAGKKSRKHGKNKSTIVKERLDPKNIEDLKEDVLKVWKEFIKSLDIDDRKFASKEISKYIFPTKKDIVANITSHDEFIEKYRFVLTGSENKDSDS